MQLLVSLDSMPKLGEGFPLEKPENTDVKNQGNHSKRCKGDARKRIIDLSLDSANRKKSYIVR